MRSCSSARCCGRTLGWTICMRRCVRLLGAIGGLGRWIIRIRWGSSAFVIPKDWKTQPLKRPRREEMLHFAVGFFGAAGLETSAGFTVVLGVAVGVAAPVN